MTSISVNNPLRIHGDVKALLALATTVNLTTTDTDDSRALGAETAGQYVEVLRGGTGQPSVILPDATSLEAGAEFVILSRDTTSGLAAITTLVKSFDGSTLIEVLNTYSAAQLSAGVRVILLENVTSAGVWQIERINLEAQEMFRKEIAVEDWSGPVGNDYTYEIPASEHGRGSKVHVQIWNGARNSGGFTKQVADFSLSDTGDLVLFATQSPDTRYAGDVKIAQ